MNELYQKYKDDVEFFVVYVREAHAADSRWPIDTPDPQQIYTPKTYKDRLINAHICAIRLDLEFPCLVEEMDNAVDQAYEAFPDRLFIVDKDGLIVVRGDRGPFGFEPSVEDATRWLEEKFPDVATGTN